MKPRWDWYPCTLHGHEAIVQVDLAWAPSAPVRELATLCWVVVRLCAPLPSGLAAPEETPRLAELESALVPRVTRELGAAYVARATTQGRRELYFYARDAARLGDCARAALAAFPEHAFETGSRPDEAWSHFLGVLMPGPHELQLMHTREQLHELARRGDRGSPRQIRHFAYFADWQSRQRFGQWAQQKGFASEDLAVAEGPAPGRPFGCRLAREDRPDEATLAALVDALLEKANELGGEYDGWECDVDA